MWLPNLTLHNALLCKQMFGWIAIGNARSDCLNWRVSENMQFAEIDAM
jgi:hypothetical protein